MESKLTTYLREKYQPVAIVLHGSRANGMAREHSDWDFVLFTEKDVNPITREIVFGANIEIKQIILPMADDVFIGAFFRIDNTKVLFDPRCVASVILTKNDEIYSKGNQFTEIDKSKRYAFLMSALDGIVDYKDIPLVLFDKKIDFYTRVIDAWFRFMKSEFEISHYYAFPKIKNEDPEFYAMVMDFVSQTKSEDLVNTGNKMIKHIFPDM